MLENIVKTYVRELCKYGTCIGLSPNRQRRATRECESPLALKDLGKLWNSAYCSLIHFCVNEKHVLNLSREIRWISLLLSFCQCRFTVSTGIIVQPIWMCIITFLCRGNLEKVELMIRTANHVSQQIQTASNSERTFFWQHKCRRWLSSHHSSDPQMENRPPWPRCLRTASKHSHSTDFMPSKSGFN